MCYDMTMVKRGGVIISEKRKYGHRVDKLKDIMFRVRINDEIYKKLEIAAEKLGTTKSDVVRRGIDLMYDSLTKK